jgi:uncharacterized protein YxeA
MKTIVVWVLLILVSVSIGGIWKYNESLNAHNYNLQITSSSPPTGQTISIEQRLRFAQSFEKLFKDKGMDAKVTIQGEGKTNIVITGKLVNASIVYRMKDNIDAIADLREMGFKHLVITDGKTSWDVDLKN